MKNFTSRILQNVGLIVISLGLLYGGVGILRTGIPFWSLVYGIPAIALGILMSLISFNEIAKNNTAKTTDYHQLLCRVCGKGTLAPMLIDSIVCTDCQYKTALKIQTLIGGILVLIAIPISIQLVQQTQDVRQNASYPVPSPECETDDWQPLICKCGSWTQDTRCSKPKLSRVCAAVIYCCEEGKSSWICSKL